MDDILKKQAEKIQKIIPYKVDYYKTDKEKSIVITRPNTNYHFHIFLVNGKFYCEFPPNQQIYSESEKYNITYNDYEVFKEIILNGFALAITDKIWNKLRPSILKISKNNNEKRNN